MSAIEKYNEYLSHLSGMVGQRNLRIMSIAALGHIAGIDASQCANDIMSHGGSPALTEAEVKRAVEKAYSSPLSETRIIRPTPTYSGIVRRLIDLGQSLGVRSVDDLRSCSPVQISSDPREQFTSWVRRLWSDDSYIYAGDRYGNKVTTVSDLLARMTVIPPHVATNAYTGKTGETMNGKQSQRAKSEVLNPHYALIEFDALPLDEQASFVRGYLAQQENGAFLPGPIVSVVYSGSKSLHTLIDLHARAVGRFQRQPLIKSWTDSWYEIQAKFCSESDPVTENADKACKDPSRLTRAPGHLRDNGKMQELIYLSKKI